MPTETLKPCPVPWCEKSDPRTLVSRSHSFVCVTVCRSCGLNAPEKPSRAEAEEIWNTRPPDAVLEAAQKVADPTHSGLIAACNRLLKIEKDILSMPKWARDWFMGKPGHQDCFDVARGLLEILLRDEVSTKTRREASRDLKADMYGENGNG